MGTAKEMKWHTKTEDVISVAEETDNSASESRKEKRKKISKKSRQETFVQTVRTATKIYKYEFTSAIK